MQYTVPSTTETFQDDLRRETTQRTFTTVRIRAARDITNNIYSAKKRDTSKNNHISKRRDTTKGMYNTEKLAYIHRAKKNTLNTE